MGGLLEIRVRWRSWCRSWGCRSRGGGDGDGVWRLQLPRSGEHGHRPPSKMFKKKKKLRYCPPCSGTHTRRIIPVLHGNLLHGYPSHRRRDAACLRTGLVTGLSWCWQKPQPRWAVGRGRRPLPPCFSKNKWLS